MNLNLIKTRLNVAASDTTQDDVLTSIYESCKHFFTSVTGLLLDATSCSSHYINVSGATVFYLEETPVRSLTSIFLDGVEITDYTLVDDCLIFTTAITGTSLVIEYEAGYTTIPEDIDDLLIQMLQFLYNQDGFSNYVPQANSKTLTPAKNVFPGYIKEQLDGYKI